MKTLMSSMKEPQPHLTELRNRLSDALKGVNKTPGSEMEIPKVDEKKDMGPGVEEVVTFKKKKKTRKEDSNV